jgi:hypothetical protein
MASKTGTRPDSDDALAPTDLDAMNGSVAGNTLHGTGFHGSIVSASNDGVETPATSQKICVACGKDVAGKKRFKDSAGQYWCYECGVRDSVQRHPEEGTECPDCHARFAPVDMVELEGKQYCKPCSEKRAIAIKREKARLARVEIEAREEAEHRKRMLIGGAVAAVVAAGIAAYVIFT